MLIVAYTNVNLKYDIKDSYSGIPYYLNTILSFFFNKNFVHYRRHCIALENTVSNNCVTILLIKRFLVKDFRPFKFHVIKLH